MDKLVDTGSPVPAVISLDKERSYASPVRPIDGLLIDRPDSLLLETEFLIGEADLPTKSFRVRL
jgi:hypothetical protein